MREAAFEWIGACGTPGITFASSQCEIVSGQYPNVTYHARTKGSVFGPVGTNFDIGGDIYPNGSHVLRCDSWTTVPTEYLGGRCERRPGALAPRVAGRERACGRSGPGWTDQHHERALSETYGHRSQLAA